MIFIPFLSISINCLSLLGHNDVSALTFVPYAGLHNIRNHTRSVNSFGLIDRGESAWALQRGKASIVLFSQYVITPGIYSKLEGCFTVLKLLVMWTTYFQKASNFLLLFVSMLTFKLTSHYWWHYAIIKKKNNYSGDAFIQKIRKTFLLISILYSLYIYLVN